MDKVFKVYKGIVKSINEQDFTMDVVVSTADVDRDKEKINADAFKKRLKYYKDHPVLLSSHRYDDLRKQIGEAQNIKVTDQGLEAKFKYYANEGNPEADWAWVLAQKNIAGFSIGFIPFAYEDKDLAKDGYNREFTDVELVEISQVLVPSNRHAVQQRRDIILNLHEVEKELLEVAIKSFENGELKEPAIEQKPKPQDNETEEHFINRCIPMLIDEGKKPEQAAAICHSLWEKKSAEDIKLAEEFKQKVLDVIDSNTKLIIEKLIADETFLKVLEGVVKRPIALLSKDNLSGMVSTALQKENK
jgi:HK97 family phage prohead protease